MTKDKLTKVFWPASGAKPQFFVFASSPDAVEQYRKNQEQIPLVEVLASYDLHCIEQGGTEGMVFRPSQDQLDITFGTSEHDQVIKRILLEGRVMGDAHAMHPSDARFKSKTGMEIPGSHVHG